jgi:flavin-dependent dehydrogenase
MQSKNDFDVAIIGGGLAGLATSILIAQSGYSVILFEKEKYPFHKVCGEYVSLESWNFLIQLGLPLPQMGLPIIDTLLLTAPNGTAFKTKLPLGGFGISRYYLDSQLVEIAKQRGIHILDNTKVDDVVCNTNFQITCSSK